MGLLGWLFGSKPTFSNRVFGTVDCKLADLVERVKEDAEADRRSLVLYHFSNVEQRLRDAFPDADERHQLAREDISGLNGLTLLPVSGISDSLQHARNDRKPKESNLQIHLAERFPAYGPDEAVLQLAAVIAPKKKCLSYVSLEDPWVARFCDRIVHLLKRMGYKDDECLSNMDGALNGALKKLAKKCPKPWQHAESAEEWLEKNFKADR